MRKASAANLDAFVASHREWWHAYYPQSFLSVPAGRVENFYWLQYRYSMDPKLLESLYPILRRAINYYRHVMIRGEDGKIHLPPTTSPIPGTCASSATGPGGTIAGPRGPPCPGAGPGDVGFLISATRSK